MRLWSLHPCYLDAKGLVALWREGLLAQKVLLGRTKGYTRHPQLVRFKQTKDPAGTVAAYLEAVADEAATRGYAFNRDKIEPPAHGEHIAVTSGQLEYEFKHLLGKLESRDPARYGQLRHYTDIRAHPLFQIIPGGIADWEIL